MELKSLSEVPGLAPLEEICRAHKIDIIAHGSFVRRLYQKTRGNPSIADDF